MRSLALPLPKGRLGGISGAFEDAPGTRAGSLICLYGAGVAERTETTCGSGKQDPSVGGQKARALLPHWVASLLLWSMTSGGAEIFPSCAAVPSLGALSVLLRQSQGLKRVLSHRKEFETGSLAVTHGPKMCDAYLDCRATAPG